MHATNSTVEVHRPLCFSNTSLHLEELLFFLRQKLILSKPKINANP